MPNGVMKATGAQQESALTLVIKCLLPSVVLKNNP
jgi:hypothetical protein